MDVFLLRVRIEFFDATLAADAGALITTEGRTLKMLADIVDPQIPDIYARGRTVSAF
jgi:hypothetical protein